MASFEIEQRLELRLTAVESVALSLSQYLPPAKKDLLGTEHSKAARKTPLEHLAEMARHARIKDFSKPLMVVSVRNVLSNLRCVAYLAGYTKRPIGVAEEYTYLRFTSDVLDGLKGELADTVFEAIAADGTREVPVHEFFAMPEYAGLNVRKYGSVILAHAGILNHNRSYHILGQKNDGSLTIEEYNPGTDASDYRWFISGVPVLWDKKDDEDPDASSPDDEDTLFRRIVTEAADHSHVWRLPRGSHPEATATTRAQWKALQEIFIKTLTGRATWCFVLLTTMQKART